MQGSVLKHWSLVKIYQIEISLLCINGFSLSLSLTRPFSSSLSNRCDPGFSGPACELASQTFPAFLSEGFSSPRLSSYHSFSSLRGAEVSFGCGVLASGKALVFNRDSRRHLITAPLDSSQARLVRIPKANLSDVSFVYVYANKDCMQKLECTQVYFQI